MQTNVQNKWIKPRFEGIPTAALWPEEKEPHNIGQALPLGWGAALAMVGRKPIKGLLFVYLFSVLVSLKDPLPTFCAALLNAKSSVFINGICKEYHFWGWGLGGGWGRTGASHAPLYPPSNTPLLERSPSQVSEATPPRCSHLSSLLGWWESGRRDPIFKTYALKASLSPAVQLECSSVPREQLFQAGDTQRLLDVLNLAAPTEIIVFVFDLGALTQMCMNDIFKHSINC